MTYKGSRHRTGGEDFKKYQKNETLWNNLKKNKTEKQLKKNKTEKELKKRLLAESGIEILTRLEEQGE
jgi:hypothetical protein